MSNPDDQRPAQGQQRPAQDRGYYGAGWTAPQQQPGPYGQPQPQQPGASGRPTRQDPYGRQQAPAQRQAPYAPPFPGAPSPRSRTPRQPANPASAFAPGVAAAHVQSAAVAVLGLFAILLLIGAGFTTRGIAVAASSGIRYSPLGDFVTSWIAEQFPFLVGAFLCLVFLTPIVRRSALPVVLARAAIAGAGGAVAMMLVGIGTGSYHALTLRDPYYWVTDLFATPFADGVQNTAILLATATIAWLWLGRPKRAPRPVPYGSAPGVTGATGTPGTVPPADAVPPATLQQPPYPQQQQPVQQQQPAPQPPAQQQPGPVPPMPPSAGPAPYGPSGAPRTEQAAQQHWSTSAPSAREPHDGTPTDPRA